eukprot:RCo038447
MADRPAASDAAVSTLSQLDLMSHNHQLQAELRASRKELTSTKIVAETLKAQVSHLIHTLQMANQKIAEQREVIEDCMLVKAELQQKLQWCDHELAAARLAAAADRRAALERPRQGAEQMFSGCDAQNSRMFEATGGGSWARPAGEAPAVPPPEPVFLCRKDAPQQQKDAQRSVTEATAVAQA